MARCYHDEQDIKSDLNIEVAREGDILEYGEDLPGFKECKKNPGHAGFIPFKDLKLEDLPQEERSIDTLESIKRWGNYVVRLVVHKIKNGRLVKEAGTGYVFKSGNSFRIKTNNHVIKTDDEVKKCTVYFLYDSHDSSNELTSKGEKLVYTCPFRDISFFSFHPVPDIYQTDLKDPLLSPPSIVIGYKNDSTMRCRSTRIWLPRLIYYTSQNLNNPQIDNMFVYLVDSTISYLKSSYFKFKPIPSNIQELTSIEIRIDEDDGNSTVIPGDVVKFNDEFVVKISESIFQDEVKKCRLIWNGEVISRGTRLYFQQVTPKELFSDMTESQIDLELCIESTSPNSWLFDFYPQPRGLEQIDEMVTNFKPVSNIVCCIGHPHGGIRMVSFGRMIEQKLERFNNKYRRISPQEDNCNCKEINCVKYSCKTCPGSSGSPVLVPSKVFYMITSSTHFLGEKVSERLLTGELIDNKNTGLAVLVGCDVSEVIMIAILGPDSVMGVELFDDCVIEY